MSNKNNINIGNAGEYFVAGELERRKFIVAVPMSNVERFDILAISKEKDEKYAIQVKTTFSNKKEWTLSKKNENLFGECIFYVFVSLNGFEPPSYHIVPSEIVAENIKTSHQEWLKRPGKNGNKHNDSNIRHFSDKEEKYLNRWDLLK